MSRWQEFGFPDQLKFTSPMKAMRGITLAVEERLRQAYPGLAENWYAGNLYLNPFNLRTYAPLYPIEYQMTSNYLNHASDFPAMFPNNQLINSLSSLSRITLSNPARTICGFWDFSKRSSGLLEVSETAQTGAWYVDQNGRTRNSIEDSCGFTERETDDIPEEFRFQNVFSERYFRYLYEKINPLTSYLSIRLCVQDDDSFLYRYEAEPIENLTFSD